MLKRARGEDSRVYIRSARSLMICLASSLVAGVEVGLDLAEEELVAVSSSDGARLLIRA